MSAARVTPHPPSPSSLDDARSLLLEFHRAGTYLLWHPDIRTLEVLGGKITPELYHRLTRLADQVITVLQEGIR